MKKITLLAFAVFVFLSLTHSIHFPDSKRRTEAKVDQHLDLVRSDVNSIQTSNTLRTVPQREQPQSKPILRVLNEILESKNDNDSRIDTHFLNLSGNAKASIQAKYFELQAEMRNEKGLIVHLLGKNITQEKDLRFFETVLLEPACLSLKDCTQNLAINDSIERVTLAYPQIIALISVKKYLSQHPESETALRLIKLKESSNIAVLKRIANSPMKDYERDFN
jgi:hypothetical protein